MDEKTFQVYAKAKAFLYEQTGKRYGESWKATFTLKGADEKGASKDGEKST